MTTARPAPRLALAAALALVALPREPNAQPLRRVSLHLEGAVGGQLTAPQSERFGLGYGVGGRVAVRIVGPLAVQGGAATWWWPGVDGGPTGRLTTFSAGPRGVFELSRALGSVFVDLEAGLGVTGGDGLQRVYLGAGAGWTIPLAAGLVVGPVLRVGDLVASPPAGEAYDDNGSGDAPFWSASVVVGWQGARPSTPVPPPPIAPPRAAPPPAPSPPAPPPPPPPPPPPVDTDGDGVLDPADACPDVPAGAHPDPARVGCPLADRDRDTVPDVTDHCPDEPGAPSLDPQRNGCPSNVRVTGQRIEILEPVHFDTARATIRRRSHPLLASVADVMQASTDIRRVSIEGHCDDRGDPQGNLELSQRRVESVMRWLTEHGVDAARLEAHGFGDTRPVASNRSGSGRARNRRVEFRIVDPAPATPDAAPETAADLDDRGHDRHGRRRHRRR